MRGYPAGSFRSSQLLSATGGPPNVSFTGRTLTLHESEQACNKPERT